jgi:hypothetical protein
LGTFPTTATLMIFGLLEPPVEEIARKLSQNDEEGDYIRQTRPSFIALPVEVRLRLVDESKA